MDTEARKLAALLFADMAGYSALRQMDSLDLRREMMSLASEGSGRHRGRIVNTMGDGFFAEFPTALDAIQFALELQNNLGERNSKLNGQNGTALRLRIGVHVGEVIIHGENLHGDSVNIAARTEKLAVPGGICMTSQVWEQVRDDIKKQPRALGKVRARHIRQPLTLYHIDPEGLGLVSRLAHRLRTGSIGAAKLPLILFAVALIGTTAWESWELWRKREPKTAKDFLERASERLGRYDKEGAISGAISDLNAAMELGAKNSYSFGRLAWANWLAFEEDEREFTKAEASFWASNSISANGGNPEGHMVAGMVCNANRDWKNATNHLYIAKSLNKSTDGLTLVSLALTCFVARELTNAFSFARQAQEAGRDRWDVFDRLGSFYLKVDSPGAGLESTLNCYRRAVACARDSPIAHLHLGQALLLNKEPSEAEKEFNIALKYRKSASVYAALGSVWLEGGRPEKAAELFEKAIKLNPTNYLYHFNAGLALWNRSLLNPSAARHFTNALLRIDDALSLEVKSGMIRSRQGFCHAALGQADLARPELEKALNLAPEDKSVLSVVRRAYQILGDIEKVREIEEKLRQKPGSKTNP